jgi:hypothetical protein
MTERIRWEDDGRNGFEGYAGTLDRHLFAVWQSPCDSGDIILGEWALTTQLPAPLEWRTPHGSDPEALKAEAERWLAEFVSSLGAIFPRIPDAEPAGLPIPRFAVLAVACPRCGADQQEWCVTHSGLPAEAHRERYRMAERAGILRKFAPPAPSRPKEEKG